MQDNMKLPLIRKYKTITMSWGKNYQEILAHVKELESHSKLMHTSHGDQK